MIIAMSRKKHLFGLVSALLVPICWIVLLSDDSSWKARRALPSRGDSLVCYNRPNLNTVPTSSTLSDLQTQALVNQTYGRLPLSFEANQGQADSEVKFLSRGSGYGLYLTSTEAVLTFQSTRPRGQVANKTFQRAPSPIDSSQSVVLRARLVGAHPPRQVEGLRQLPGKSNYILGNDPSKWLSNIPNYAGVRYRETYPGIDLVYYGSQGKLEYDFVVAPGANPNVIALAFDGARDISIDENGELVLETEVGEIRQHKPVIYQQVNGVRKEVPGRYAISSGHEIHFEIGSYDANKQLVIDPVLSYAAYLGGGSGGFSVAVDSAGSAYVTGGGDSSFPTTGGPSQTSGGGAFVMKLNAAGTALVYSTFLGPGLGRSVAVDSTGNAYVTGSTSSDKFPTTPGAVQTSYGGGDVDAFVAKLSPNGSSLVYSTYLGGESSEAGSSIALDSTGNAYVTGYTNSRQFPTTPAALQTSFGGGATYGDIFVTTVNAEGTALLYSTYIGGGGDEGFVGGITVDSSGNAFVTTRTTSTNFPTTPGAFKSSLNNAKDLGDATVSKLNSTGSALLYSTYLGGNGLDEGRAIAVDSSGNAYVTGFTTSSDFPVVPGAFDPTCSGCVSPPPGAGGGSEPFVVSGDAFVTKLNAGGTALVYSTFLGGGEDDGGYGIAVNASGNAYVTGVTSSEDFPTTKNAVRPPADSNDAFVTKLDVSGSALHFSTYFGGRSTDISHGVAVDSASSIYVAGYTLSSDLPTTPGSFQAAFNFGGNAFVAKILMGPGTTSARVKGRKLLVFGDNFEDGAVIVLNGDEQRTRNDEENPKTTLIGKKAGRDITPGQTVTIQFKNPDGVVSLTYNFTRPVD